MSEVGSRIIKAREKKGLTQAQTAKAIGVDRSFLWRIEAGKKTASLSLLQKLAEVLDVAPSYFLQQSPLPAVLKELSSQYNLNEIADELEKLIRESKIKDASGDLE